MRYVIVLVMGVLLAGCAAITEPFGIEDPFAIPHTFQGLARDNEMLHPGVGIPTIVVELPRGLDGELASDLQSKIMKDLDERDIGAAGDAMPNSWTLKGRASMVVTSDQISQPRGVVIWRLFDADHRQRSQFSTVYRGDQPGNVEPRVSELARQVGMTVAAVISPDGSGQIAPGSGDTTPVAADEFVWIGAVKGAPGDGNIALARALQVALPEKGLRVASDIGLAAWRLECEVTLKTASASEDHVVLVWRLLDPASKEVGTLRQENPVPHGSLNRSWGEVAGYAAEGAADGVQQILQQIRDGKPK